MMTTHDRARRASVFTSRTGAPLLLLLAAWLSGCDLFSGDDEDRTLADFPVERATLLEHLNFLAADSMYGRRAGSTYELRAAEYIRDEFVAYGLEPGVAGYLQTFPIDLPGGQEGGTGAGGMSQVVSQNVLAALPGRGTLADEWVVLGAHYDHVGFEASGDSFVVYNGADDNGSGTALLLELARVVSEFAVLDPSADRRSIMFQAYGAEEIGLVGSYYFTSNPTVPVETIVAMLNLDMVGRLRENTLVVRGISTGAWWLTMLTELNAGRLEMGFPGGTSGRSDQYPFYLLGIPILHFFTGTHAEYHTPFDDIGLLNLGGIEEIGRLVGAVLWELAVSPDLAVLQRLQTADTLSAVIN